MLLKPKSALPAIAVLAASTLPFTSFTAPTRFPFSVVVKFVSVPILALFVFAKPNAVSAVPFTSFTAPTKLVFSVVVKLFSVPIASAFFVICVSKAEASTLIVGPSLFALVLRTALPLPVSSKEIV